MLPGVGRSKIWVFRGGRTLYVSLRVGFEHIQQQCAITYVTRVSRATIIVHLKHRATRIGADVATHHCRYRTYPNKTYNMHA